MSPRALAGSGLGPLLVAALVGACSSSSARETSAADDLIGGAPVRPGELPSTLRIQGNCTATKVGSRHILIAAHCVFDTALRPQFVQGARIEVTTETLITPATRLAPLTIAKTNVHPEWERYCSDPNAYCSYTFVDESNRVPDVALVVTNEDITGIPSASIDTEPLAPGEAVIVTGYGCESAVGSPWSYEKAGLRAGVFALLAPSALLHPGSSVTTATLNRVANHDLVTPGPAFVTPGPGLCPGDSGGPLYRASGRGATVAGVNTSYTFTSTSGNLPVTNRHTRLDDQTPTNVGGWLASLGASTCRGATCPVGALAQIPSTWGEPAPSVSSAAELDPDGRDPACQRALLDAANVEQAVTTVLGVPSSCMTLHARRYAESPSYYYGGTVVCSLRGTPSAEAGAGFTAEMAARGFAHYVLEPGSASGPKRTAVCSSYPNRSEACLQSLPSVTTVADAVGSALGVTASCVSEGIESVPLTTSSVPNDTYYEGRVSCSLSARPSDPTLARFAEAMAANGYQLQWNAATNGVTGTVSSWPCSAF